MAMWTEYEGTTIGSGFPLTKLLQPEGRSALFSTLDEKGSVKILRLIESHFDEEEILTRWKAVAALKHPHLLRLEDYGQVSLDDTILVYAVMEPADANLGEVLVNQRLTQTECRQLAESIGSALEALHSHGFVHEHMEPGSILAVGEIVKLRSDCIREAPEGAEGQALKQRDIQNLSTVLLMALTQQRTLEAAGFLPAPFDRVIARGLRGEMSAAEIVAAFQVKPAEPPPTPAPAPTAAAAPAKAAAAAATPTPAAAAPARVAAAPARPASFERETYGESRSMARATVLGVGILIVLFAALLAWRFFHHSSATPAKAAPAVVVEPPPTPAPTSAASLAPRQSKAKPSAAAAAVPAAISADTRDGWRVIAFTYNRDDQARHKAEMVAQEHPDLDAQVFSPSGRAPYLVSLGGVMSKDQAFAFAAKAHREGMPHDVYARHYHGR